MTTEEEVVALVARKTGISVSKITPEKTFYQLGIDGDDAVELIDELCERVAYRGGAADEDKAAGKCRLEIRYPRLLDVALFPEQAGVLRIHLICGPG